LLGNGYRAYNPRLMRFHSPDSWSPFGGGGLNAYMYCVGDPVNRSDPTGHWGVLALLSRLLNLAGAGYATSVAGIGVNITVLALNRGRATLANGLGLISGFTGAAAGASAILNLTPRASQLLSATSLISGVASNYLGARSLHLITRRLGWYERPFRRPAGNPPAYFDLFAPPSASRALPPNPPAYPLNHSSVLPAAVGKPPAYSRQDPNLFSTPLLDAENPHRFSTHPEPIGVSGTLPSRSQTQLRQEHLDRLDGLSRTIRQRR
jgi:hypothetical protein